MIGLRQGKMTVSMAIRRVSIVSVSGYREHFPIHRIFTGSVSVLYIKRYEPKRPKTHTLALSLRYENTN